MDIQAYKHEYYLKNKDRLSSRYAIYRAEHKEEIKEYNKLYRLRNAAKVKISRDAWRLQNKGWKKEWDKNNLHLHRANTARRKATKEKATPKWANEFFIGETYRLAALRSKLTGIAWEVDHVVPLRSKTVCGLHVENNLRVVPAVENQRKGNRYWPDMPT